MLTQSAKPDVSIANQRILVVDDNQTVLYALERLLRGQGYDPVVFDEGRAALRYAASPGHLDAALIDIHLPDLSGLDLTHALRQQLGDELPIIIISGDNSMDTLRTLPIAGATYFISKPVNVGHLLQQLKQCMA